MKRILYLFIISLLPILHTSLSGQKFQFGNETAYLSELVYHTSQTDEDGLDFIGWFLNTSSLTFKEKHSLNVGLMVTHGGEPSANIVGDLQTFSNLEAGFLYGFNEVYYQYEDEDFWLKLGQVDINTDFAFTENGLLFTHSSFGIDPAITLNMPAPTYPVTGASITSQIPISPGIKLRLGIFDGQFAEPQNDFLRIDWSINKNEGMLYIIEPEFSLIKGKLIQKIGFYHHSGLFLDRTYHQPVPSNIVLRPIRGLSAFYSITDLLVKEWTEDKSLNIFLQTAWSQKNVSLISNYLGFGLRGNNLFETKGNNEIGLAVAYANVNSEDYYAEEWEEVASETVIEINYKQQVNEWFSIQPYFHYLGLKEYQIPEMKNPIVAAIRAYIEF